MEDKKDDFIADVESGFNDTVFRSSNYNSRHKANNALTKNTSSLDGTFYHEPDDKTYVFKNTKYDVYTSQHGIIRPVRFNNILSNRLKNGLAKRQAGVYIIKYFNHYKNKDIKTILTHYATTATDIDMEVLDTLTGELTNFITMPNHNVLKFRIIKFIPESVLMKEGVVHDDLLNGNVIIGDPSRLSNNTKHSRTTTLTIEIFDNNQDVYHMTIGNQIHSIYTSNNSNGKVDGHIKLINHGMVLIDKPLTDNNIKDFGLYASRKEALEVVNIDKRLEMEKLKHEKMKQDNEIELTKLKRQIQIEGFAADMYKRKLDIEITKLKFNSDKIKLYTTASSTYVKTGIDIGTKIITMFLPVPGK